MGDTTVANIVLTSQISLLARLHLLGSGLDELLQRLVLDVVGAPLRHRELGQVAAELHLDEYSTLCKIDLFTTPSLMSSISLPSKFGVCFLCGHNTDPILHTVHGIAGKSRESQPERSQELVR
jgi:hypothetical protein